MGSQSSSRRKQGLSAQAKIDAAQITAYAVANLLIWYPSWSIPARLINLNFLTMLKQLAPTFYVAAAMAVVMWPLGLMFPSNWSYAIRLTVQVLFGILVYWGLLHLFKVDAYRTASGLVFKLLGQRSA